MIGRRMIKKIALTTLMMSTSMAQEEISVVPGDSTSENQGWHSLPAELKDDFLRTFDRTALLKFRLLNSDIKAVADAILFKPGADLSKLSLPKTFRTSGGSYRIIQPSPSRSQLDSIACLSDVKEIKFILELPESLEEANSKVMDIINFATLNPNIKIHVTLFNAIGDTSIALPTNLTYSVRGRWEREFYQNLITLNPETAHLGFAAYDILPKYYNSLRGGPYNPTCENYAYAMIVMLAAPHVTITSESLRALSGLSEICLAAAIKPLFIPQHPDDRWYEGRLPGDSAQEMYRLIQLRLNERFPEFATNWPQIIPFVSEFFAQDELVNNPASERTRGDIYPKPREVLQKLFDLRLKLSNVSISDFMEFIKYIDIDELAHEAYRDRGYSCNDRLNVHNIPFCYNSYRKIKEHDLLNHFKHGYSNDMINLLEDISRKDDRFIPGVSSAIQKYEAAFKGAEFSDESGIPGVLTPNMIEALSSDLITPDYLLTACNFLKDLDFSRKDAFSVLMRNIVVGTPTHTHLRHDQTSSLTQDQLESLFGAKDHLLQYVQDSRYGEVIRLINNIRAGFYGRKSSKPKNL